MSYAENICRHRPTGNRSGALLAKECSRARSTPASPTPDSPMLLAPRYLPRLAATVGLFAGYGLHRLCPPAGPARARPAGRSRSGRGSPGRRPCPGLPRAARRARARLREARPGPLDPGPTSSAELRDGRSVVVKVQRPGIRASLAEDIDFFRELARSSCPHPRRRPRRLGRHRPAARAGAGGRIGLSRGGVATPPLLPPLARRVPTTCWSRKSIEAYTTERVLTRERVRGFQDRRDPPAVRLDARPLAARRRVRVRRYLKQVAIDGHFTPTGTPGTSSSSFPACTTHARPRRSSPPNGARPARGGHPARPGGARGPEATRPPSRHPKKSRASPSSTSA